MYKKVCPAFSRLSRLRLLYLGLGLGAGPACSGEEGSYAPEGGGDNLADAIEYGVIEAAQSFCDGPYDPDCFPQPDIHCGYTTGSCPTGKHSVYRHCWANCGDYVFGASNPCAADQGANAILCEDNSGDVFTTCDFSCPKGYMLDGSLGFDSSCGVNVSRIRCKKRPPEFLLRHSGGLCVHPSGGSSNPSNDTPTVLHPLCSNESRLKFRLLSNGSLQHVSSGKCVHPNMGSETPSVGTPLVYWDGCSAANNNKKLRFEFTPGGSIRHVNSGLCVHPSGGSPNPDTGTWLVLWTGCDESRLRFDKVTY